MKKTYQAPIAYPENVFVDNAILAASPGLKEDGYDAESEVLSREFSWGSADDEMDEDF